MVFFAIVLAIPAIAGIAMAVVRSNFYTNESTAVRQPVQFSHRHHVQRVGLDCRYCHTSVEKTRFAGIPPTHICMTCHSQLWTDSPMLKPVRDSLTNNEPIAWNRVNNLPDYVYFDHSIHIQKGVACVICHGRIDEMALVYPVHTFHMKFCLNCHRKPEQYIRPKEDVFDMQWTATPDTPGGKILAKRYGIATHQLTDCTICHR